MPFETGTRLGPYEVIAPIGAGGMGEVYRARDTRLDRIVAIKILMRSLAADPESRQRFEHEARVIAALNDPHICTIHDVGRHGELDYLVLEFLEGETLADRLRRSPAVTITEALTIAVQIGDALDRAHRAGIVHRDLKPGNVMLLRREGSASGTPLVKLLDFGLASRVTVARPPVIDVSLGETTVTPPLEATQFASPPASGFSGTVQYMAPEQIDGDPGDHRTDIFAFGCVLYEMLAGRKAFEGSSAVSVIAAIANTEPAPISTLQSTHPALDHVMRRCLEKDRERRWQHVRDVTGELRWIASEPLAPVAAASTRQRRLLPLYLAALVLAAIAIVVPMLRGPARAPDALTYRLEIATAPTDDPSIALSPDGRQIAFVANQNRVPVLWVRPLDAVEARALPGTEGASFPFWSPDGRTLGFFAGDKLKRIEITGGTPIVITDARNARGGTWNADGVILFAPGVGARLSRVSTSGGAVEPVTEVEATGGRSHRFPQFLPDGKRFLFTSQLGSAETNGVYIGSLDKTPPVRVLLTSGAGRFAAPDTLIAIRQGALQAFAFDPATGTVRGEPTVIAQGFAGGASSSGNFAASETGLLAYRAGAAQRRQLVWVDRTGAVLRPIGEPETDYAAGPELSPDESAVAMFRQPSGTNNVWITELSRNVSRRISEGTLGGTHPLWDPDGQHIVFGAGGPMRRTISGANVAPLFAGGEKGLALAWTRDRQYVLVSRPTASNGSDLIAVATSTPPREVPVAQSQYDESEGQFSGDGKWVAFVSNESGREEVFVQAFPSGAGKTQVSIGGGTQVRWSSDGSEVFYLSGDGKMMAVSIATAADRLVVQPPVALFATHLASGINVLGSKPQSAVARDGRFLLNTVVESPGSPIVISINWRHGSR
jgi:serine/threonine protein kinase/Tol biopolymer transport system component